MVASCKLLGFNELGIRFPNALAGVVICFIVFFFCTSVFDSPLKGFFSAVILVSTAGLVRLHVLRSGEYDAFLVMFITIYCFSYFLILEGNSDKRRQLWLIFTLSMIGAILTKGIAALLVSPALIIYSLIRRKLKPFLKQKEVYISTFLIVLFGLGYYLLREHYNPGYIQAVRENELGGRYSVSMIKSGPFDYLIAIVTNEFRYWLIFALIGIYINLRSQDQRVKNFTIFCSLVVTVQLTVISYGSTHLGWYDAPIFPFLAIMAAFGLSSILDLFFKYKSSLQKPSAIRKYIAIAFVLAVTLPSYLNIIAHDLASPWEKWNSSEFLVYYIKMREKKGMNLNGMKIINDSSLERALICQTKVSGLSLKNVQIGAGINSLIPGDTVIVGQEDQKEELRKRFALKNMDTYNDVNVLLLMDRK
jgi:4-amino-4-deoxy-L-arabinose transferase-like glycosyltransferase